jgi:large conductance mechanosensitive channel
MPRDVDREASESDSLLDRGHREIRRFWDGFIDFAFQGHILQIAFGLMSVPP